MAQPQVVPQNVATVPIEGALAAFRSLKGWAAEAVAQLPDDRLHAALDPNTNGIAVIMKRVMASTTIGRSHPS